MQGKAGVLGTACSLDSPAGLRDPYFKNHVQRMSLLRRTMDGLTSRAMPKIEENERVLHAQEVQIHNNCNKIEGQRKMLQELKAECSTRRKEQQGLRGASQREGQKLREVQQQVARVEANLDNCRWQEDAAQEELATLKQECEEKLHKCIDVQKDFDCIEKEVLLLREEKAALSDKVERLHRYQHNLVERVQLAKALQGKLMKLQSEWLQVIAANQCADSDTEEQQCLETSADNDIGDVCCQVAVGPQHKTSETVGLEQLLVLVAPAKCNKDQKLFKTNSLKLAAARAKSMCRNLFGRSSNNQADSARGSSAGGQGTASKAQQLV